MSLYLIKMLSVPVLREKEQNATNKTTIKILRQLDMNGVLTVRDSTRYSSAID